MNADVHMYALQDSKVKEKIIELWLKCTHIFKGIFFVAAILPSYPFSEPELGALSTAALWQKALSTKPKRWVVY